MAEDGTVFWDSVATMILILFEVGFVTRARKNWHSIQAGGLFAFSLDDFGIAFWTEGMFAGEIAVFRADRERRGDRDVGKRESLERAADQLFAGFRVGETL